MNYWIETGNLDGKGSKLTMKLMLVKVVILGRMRNIRIEENITLASQQNS
jgi:hypothetical protein